MVKTDGKPTVAWAEPASLCNCNQATNTVVDGNEGHNPMCPAHPRNRKSSPVLTP